MHATSTPTLAQPKPSAFGAIAAAALAVGIAAGAIAAVNLAPNTGSATSESGSVTQIERGLQLQRQGEIGAGAAAVTSLVGPSSMDVLRAAGGWYAFQPAGSAFKALSGDVRWYVFPSTTADDEPVGISHR